MNDIKKKWYHNYLNAYKATHYLCFQFIIDIVKACKLSPLILSRKVIVLLGPEVNKRPYWFRCECKKKGVIKASLYAECYSLSSLFLTDILFISLFTNRLVCVCVYIYIYISKNKVGNRNWGWPKGSPFNSYYTEVLERVLLLSLDCSTLPFIYTL